MREEYFGFDFSWFCYDNHGMVGEFITGYEYIPNQILDDESSYNGVLEYFHGLSDISNSELSISIKKGSIRISQRI
jgi:hypothetical protein